MEVLRAEVESVLKEIFVEERAANSHNAVQSEAIDVMENFVLGSGKRLRPLGLLSFYIGGGGQLTDPETKTKILRLAAAMELMHDSTLAVDDVMDEDEYRRNQKTVVKDLLDRYVSRRPDQITGKFLFTSTATNFASSVSVLIGNLLYCMSMKLCFGFPKYVIDEVVDLFVGLNYGQILDMSKLETYDEYILNVKFKTAIFFKAIASIGLYLAGRSEEDIKVAQSWGDHFGIAFQMRDDLIDIDANSKMRKLGSGIKEGKRTAVVWTALQDGVLNAEEKTFTEEMLAKHEKAFDDKEMADKFLEILRGKPAEVVRKEISQHHNDAIEDLKRLNLTQPSLDFLKKLTDILLN
uniref:Geranylgeranyl pyrophosphate synthetase, putative n=1 Tax=Entamoeba invadens TaxID=33085 RepID=S0AZ59_ENTIV|nr:geranylgeranyl pyrophosphate synthetase, putative [Entamoeba invadens]